MLSALAKEGKHDRLQGNEQMRERQGQRRQSSGAVGEGGEGRVVGWLLKWLIP